MRLSVVLGLAVAAGAQDCPAGKESSIGGPCTFCDPWIFDIKFPNLYEKVLERLALVNVDMSFSLECVISRKVTFQDRLLANTIGPIVAILVVLALGVLYLRFKRHKDEERDERKRTTTLVIAQLVLLIMFLSYTSTSTIIFSYRR